MSIESAVSRVGELLAMQRQLSAGLAAATTPSQTSTARSLDTSGTTSTTFSSALSSALGAGAAASPVTDAGALASPATGAGDSRVQAMINMADSLVGKPYVWGGGHGSFAPTSGYDCSGFVSAVLHAGGYLSTPADTTSLPSQPGIQPGPGQYVTIYDRAQPGNNGHVIIEIGGQFYESGGMAGPWGGGGGVEKIGRPSDSYLATFETVLHPAGL